MQEFIILLILIIVSSCSIFIPHNDKVYNLSWWSRWLVTLTILYASYCLVKVCLFIATELFLIFKN